MAIANKGEKIASLTGLCLQSRTSSLANAARHVVRCTLPPSAALKCSVNSISQCDS